MDKSLKVLLFIWNNYETRLDFYLQNRGGFSLLPKRDSKILKFLSLKEREKFRGKTRKRIKLVSAYTSSSLACSINLRHSQKKYDKNIFMFCVYHVPNTYVCIYTFLEL